MTDLPLHSGVGVGVDVGVWVGVKVGVGVGVAPEVILQSKTAVKSKTLQGSVFVGVGVGQFVKNKVSSKSGHKLKLPVGPNNIHVPPLVSDKHHLVSVVL